MVTLEKNILFLRHLVKGLDVCSVFTAQNQTVETLTCV